MTHVTNIQKAATSILITAGFIILPLAAFAAPIATIQTTTSSNSTNGISYHIIITNTGDQTANDVFINDTLDADETFVSSVLSPDISSTQNGRMTLTWHTPSINPGMTYTIDLNTAVNGNFPTGTVITDDIQVEGLNFPPQTSTTTVLTGAIVAATPTPSPTLSPTPTPVVTPAPTLPVTGVDPLILTLIILAGVVAGTWVSRLSLKNS